MKITSIKISNFRGIEAREIVVAPGGFVAAGKNGSGKTSILGAIRSALAAQDISADAVRIGERQAEIYVDLDDVSVRRVISAYGSKVTVEKGGMRAQKPTAFLTELLGTSPLDPLALFLAKPKERRAQILAALPVTVTLEQLQQWAPVPPSFDVSGHGLEIVESLRASFYTTRTGANRIAEEARVIAEKAEEETHGLVYNEGGPSLGKAEACLTAAKGHLEALRAREGEVVRATERTAKTREKIEKLRREGNTWAEPPVGGDLSLIDAIATVRQAEEDFANAEQALERSRVSLGAARNLLAMAEMTAKARADEKSLNASLLAQADELEAALAQIAPPVVTEEELALAEEDVREWETAHGNAVRDDQVVAALFTAKEKRAVADAAAAEAKRLDEIVKKLSNDAPAALLASSKGISGLSLVGDDIALDGVKIESLCGAEQMQLAVEIARRANATSKILLVDGLERLDPEQLEAFIAHATRDGFQLLATRVAAGDVVIESIQPSEQAAAE
jgi:hypothetical protein